MIEKIVITGDVLRLSLDNTHSNQIANIKWLYRLLGYGLGEATGLEVEVLHSKSKNPFDARLFYTQNGLNPSAREWINIYNIDPSADAVQTLVKHLDNALVIGFELPEVFIKAMDSRGVDYIDVIIHPVRFLDDLLLGFRTNNAQIYEMLKSFEMDEQLCYLQANVHAAAMAKMKQPRLKDGSAIFSGQVEIDKSLINGDRLMSVKDYVGEIEAMSKKHRHIYVKPHPYAKDNSALKKVFGRYGNVSFVEDNFYYLLADDAIECVYSLSSSTVFEAKYWGKESQYLYKNPFYIDFGNCSFDSKEYVSIDDVFLSAHFWSRVLAPVMPTDRCELLQLPKKTSRLRNSLQNYWGYNFLDMDIVLQSYGIGHSDSSVGQLLEELQPHVRAKKESLEERLARSRRFQYLVQKLKHIPILGRFLYFIKHKVLRWH